MEKITTIQVKQKTLEKMKKAKITNRESYDEIINRLLKQNDNHL
jgi:predicted CopG family antitoxin